MNNIEERIVALETKNRELEDRVVFLDFRLNLLAEDSNVSRLLLEYKVTKIQYEQMMDLMDEFRDKLDKNESVYHSEFETRISNITNINDYHFCEAIAQAFMEDGRWEEVFPALYGKMPKYRYFMENWRKKR